MRRKSSSGSGSAAGLSGAATSGTTIATDSNFIVRRLGYHHTRSAEHLLNVSSSAAAPAAGAFGRTSSMLAGNGSKGPLPPLPTEEASYPPPPATSPVIAVALPWMNGWSNFSVRVLLGMVMLVFFSLVISLGPAALIIMIILIQTAVFREVITIAHARYRERQLSWSRTLNWYNFFQFLIRRTNRFPSSVGPSIHRACWM